VFQDWLEAAERGDTASLADHLDRGMSVDAGCAYTNTTALMMAVRGCQGDAIRFLLDRGADLDVENSLGYTALTCALILSRSWEDRWRILEPDPRPLELLIEAGARYRLREAVLLNDLELARAPLDEGADVNTGEWTYDGPLLKIASELGYLAIVDLLLDRGANLEATDDLGQTALTSAAGYGRAEVVGRLLDRGANLDAVDWLGQSALSNAACEGHDGLVEWLLSRGAQRGLVDALVRGEVGLFEALLEEKSRDDSDVDRLSHDLVRLAMLAAERGDAAIVQLLLDRTATHLQEWCDDHTLLAEAARHGRVEVARFLIDRRADLHAVGTDGLTPLAWAIQGGQDELVRLLKQAGAER
jgi:ankyrin repeat protein